LNAREPRPLLTSPALSVPSAAWVMNHTSSAG
jgi:hypothetical protein